jgi:hypothetical protein
MGANAVFGLAMLMMDCLANASRPKLILSQTRQQVFFETVGSSWPCFHLRHEVLPLSDHRLIRNHKATDG